MRRRSSAVAKAPNNTVYRFDFGEALARSGQVDAAISHFSRTVGEAEAYYNAAYILNEQGKSVRASKYLALALKSRPDLPQAQRLLAEIRSGKSPAPTLVAANSSPGDPDISKFESDSLQDLNIDTDPSTDSSIRQVSGTSESDLTPAQLEQLKNQIDLKDLDAMPFK